MSDDTSPRRHRIGFTTIDALTRAYEPNKAAAPKMATSEPRAPPARPSNQHLRLAVSNVVPLRTVKSS
jgi:hypothetical protein